MRTWIAFLLGILLSVLMIIVLVPNFLSPVDKTHSVFIYGTLQNEVVRYYACRCLTPETPATLDGYKKVGRNIIPNPGSQVVGSIIRVSEKQLARIDRYERVPSYYLRETISINDETHWVYIKQ